MITMTWPQYKRNVCAVDGVITKLAPQPAKILSVLLMNYPRLVTFGDLIEALWPDPDDQPEMARNSINSSVFQLRNQIGSDTIENEFGCGFRLLQGSVPRQKLQPPSLRPKRAPHSLDELWHDWEERKAAARLIVAEMRAAADALEIGFDLRP